MRSRGKAVTLVAYSRRQVAIKRFRGEVDPDDVTDAILKRGARFFATAVAGNSLCLRKGADVFAKVDVYRVLDRAMTERLSQYAMMGVVYNVAIVRDLVRAGSDLRIRDDGRGNWPISCAFVRRNGALPR